jgi:hypothetical protein
MLSSSLHTLSSTSTKIEITQTYNAHLMAMHRSCKEVQNLVFTIKPVFYFDCDSNTFNCLTLLQNNLLIVAVLIYDIAPFVSGTVIYAPIRYILAHRMRIK